MSDAPLKVCIILNDDTKSWIIAKMAQRLVDHAAKFGVEAVISDRPRDDVDLNHWMLYVFANEKLATPSTMLITHVDDPYKLSLVKEEAERYVDVGICMSSHAMAELVHSGVPQDSLTYVLPGHDFAVTPRRIVIGFTTRLYDDGRKREALLLKLASQMRLDAFRFDIFGSGWEKVVPVLEEAGAEVRYFPGTADYQADYRQMIEAIPHFDYYVYLGMDEGSLGTLDALASGVKTIVTPQGFHVDLPGGITHAVTTYEDVKACFAAISEGWHARIAAVRDLTWEEHTRRHAVIWRAVAAGRKASVNDLLVHAQPATSAPFANRDLAFHIRRLSPRRMLSAASHIPALKPLRAWIKGQKR
jgi:hypothetical protein